MTINLSDNDPRVSYNVAEGVTQLSFTVPFEFFDDDDLNVYVDGTLKTLTTDYTVSGGNGSTGTVTISVTGATGGSTVVITRDIDLDRTTDFPSSGPFNIGSLNTELDRIVAIAADLNDLAGRGVKLADFDTQASLTLPLASDRQNKVLGFNSTGDSLVTQELGTNKGDWATSTAYLERDIVRDSSTGSIYIVNSAHTSSGSEPLDTNPNSAKYDVIFDVGAMIAGTVTMDTLSVTGNTTLGDAATDTVTITADVASDLIPDLIGTYSLGSASRPWLGAHANTVHAYDLAGTSSFAGNVDVGTNGLDTLTINAAVDSDINPSADNTYDLGGTNKWADVKAVRITSATLGNTVGNTTIDTSSGGGIILDAGLGGIELNAANGTILIKDEATTYGRLVNTSGDLRLDSGTTTAVTFSGANATLAGTLDVTGITNFNDTTTSTNATSGAVIIDGGVGIAENANIGGNLNVTGNTTVTGNAIITGDLTVNGTTTTVNTTTINLSDNIITLNSDETGTPTQNSGFEIERGTSTNVSLIWDETADKWTIGSETFAAATIDLGNINFDAQQGTTSSTSLTTIASFAHASFSGGKLLVVATDGTDVQSTEILLVHNGSTVTSTQYGNVRTSGSDIATYSFAISGADLLIQSTAAAATATTYNVSLMLG